MSVTRIASRYAKSLIELAIEQNKLEQVNNDINLLSSVVKNRDMQLMLKSPIISADKKNAVLTELLQSKTDSLTMAYLRLLVNKGRENYLAEITHEFSVQFKQMKKVTSVTLITAAPVTDAVLADVKKKMVESGVAFENIDIDCQIDPSLIGGFVLEFDNKRYDASVSNKLTELKKQFSKNLYIKEF